MSTIDETASDVNVAKQQIHNRQNKPINLQTEYEKYIRIELFLILWKGILNLCKLKAESL